MCGISGVFNSKGVSSDRLIDSIHEISHRGPDETGFFQSEFCVLGMCRLAIIDVSKGQQPNFNTDKSIVSVFNGEIYNFLELREILLGRGHQVDGVGDSALIPYLYQEFGDSFPNYLQGMFAIAIYDSNFRELTLIRDRLGKKPLWYHFLDGGISFSSELKGLLALGIPRSFNRQVISEFLRFGYINAPRSPYSNVMQLPPATILKIKNGSLLTSRYWDVSNVEQRDISFEDALEETERLLRKAVQTRLISERPVGSFLSGGIDSTIITALMQEESTSKVQSFCIGFSESKFDESLYAARVARAIGTSHHERIVVPSPSLLVEKIGRVLDSPFADSSIIPTFLLADFAHNKVIVALSGDGGDEVFGGYERYRATQVLHKLNGFLALNPMQWLPSERFSNQRMRKLVKHSGYSSLENRYRDIQSLFQHSDFLEFLSLDLVNELNLDVYSDYWNLNSNLDIIRNLQEVDINSYLPGDLLYKVDIASMANSLEVRSPFLDYRVVEWGLSLPGRFKFKGTNNKYILRQIARKFVPPELIDRPKKGFGIPRSSWIRGELHSIIHDTLLDETSRERGWFNLKNVERALKKHKEGYELDNLIWPMFMLELWAKNWLD